MSGVAGRSRIKFRLPWYREKLPDHSSEAVEITQEQIDRVRETTQPTVALLAEVWAGLAKWLLASLVLINGGAVVAILNRSGTALDLLAIPLLIFILGIALALLAGLALATVASEALSGLLQTQMLEPGKYQADELFELRELGKKVSTQGPWPTYLGLLSLAAFMGGCLYAVCIS